MEIKVTQEDINRLQKEARQSIEQIEHYNNNPVILPNLPNFKTPKVPQYNKEILEQIQSLNDEVDGLKGQLNKWGLKDWISLAIGIAGVVIALIALVLDFNA